MRAVRAGLAAATAVAVVVAAKGAWAQCKGRPTDPGGFGSYSYGAETVQSFAGSRVRVHYTKSGQHAPIQTTTRGDGVPDTVALAASIGDDALDRYSKMGFKIPGSDASCASNGGDDKVDIYLVHFVGADGSTTPEACNGQACPTSFVLCEATFSGSGYANAEEGFKTVVTHELFHAVQNTYDQNLDRFWAEGTAQWAMKTLHPELQDFERSLPPFFKDTTRSIDVQPSGATATYLYGSAVFPLFLTKKYDPDFVRLTLEEEGKGQKVIPAIDAVLHAEQSSLADAYPLFGAWNAATKDLAGPDGYPDAAKYPGVAVKELADGVKDITSGLGYFVYRGTFDKTVGLSLDTDPERNAAVAVPVEGGKAMVGKAKKLPADATGDTLVVVAGVTTKKTDAPFTIKVGASGQGSSSSSGGSSSGGGGGGDGGCSASSSEPASGGLVAIAVALAALCRVRRRR